MRKGTQEMIPDIKKILYATDLSKNASYAFFYAVDMAKKNDATIVILHSVEPGHKIPYAEIDMENLMEENKKEEQETELNKIRRRVEGFCERMDAFTGFSCLAIVSKILVPVGHPVDEILETAQVEGCDAIVLGTHGKGFLKHTFLGSVAVKVLERSRKPVFIIPLPAEKGNIDWDSI